MMDQIYFEGYTVDRALWALQWQSEPIAISRKTFDLLVYLIDHRDAVVSKEELLSSLWPTQVVEESNLTQQIFVLRKALSRHSSGAKIIETVAGRGYRFVAEVQSAPQRQDGAAEIASVVLPERRSGARLPLVGAAMLLLAGVAVFAWHYWQGRRTGKPVAVVLADFDEVNGDPTLGRALNAAIRIDLSQSPFVKVLSPARVAEILTTMRQPKDADLTLPLARDVCERNASQIVLQGGASKFGTRYLVSLRASSCLNGELIAEDKRQVDREDDLPVAIDELSSSVRHKLGESRASIRSFDKPLYASHTGSLPALKAYTAGMREYDHGDYVAALPLLQEAVKIDPEYGDAYLDLSASYYNVGDFEHALSVLKKAYELRDTMGEPNRLYVTGLYYEMVEEDIEKSVPAYKAFAALDPSPGSLGQLANAYYREIRHARSLLHQLNAEQRAPELRARYEASISTISRMLADEGLSGDSTALMKLISPSTVNEDLLVALADDGFAARAGEELSKIRREHPHSTLWIHVRSPQIEAAILLAQRKPGDALHALEPARGFEKAAFVNTYLRGEAYLQLGQFDLAVEEFKRITESQSVDPVSNLYPLSFLEMARAQVRQSDTAAAKASYSQFLNLWKTADPDAEKLMSAKQELSHLL
jgi:eukaryotic-like serine/threonine-protein kinase